MSRAAVLALLASVALALAATTQGADGSRAAAGPTLRLAELVAPTLDPALASSPDAVLLQNALCDRLYTSSGATSTVEPQIASALPTAAPDRQRPRQWTTYTITLRTRYRFQDGTPVTAYSFAEAFARDADPDEQSPALPELGAIVGIAAVAQGQASAVSGVQAIDDRTLEISTMRADPTLAALLAQPYFCPVEEDTPIAPGGDLPDPPSAGPYEVAANDPGEIVLRQNPYYGGQRRATFATITLHSGVGFSACRRELGQGTVDICLDALPQHSDTVPLATLVSEGWISRGLGCLSWRPVIRIDLVTLCEAA